LERPTPPYEPRLLILRDQMNLTSWSERALRRLFQGGYRLTSLALIQDSANDKGQRALLHRVMPTLPYVRGP
jgi:hypothetical protein